MRIPSAYQLGYDKALAINPAIAANYIEHTFVGDPLADAAIDSLARFGPVEMSRFIQAGMEQDATSWADVPHALRTFFEQIEKPPPWFHPVGKRVYDGCRAFHNDSDLFLLAFLGDVIVRGFATLISKPFFLTGRIWDHGVRRLQRNILHLIEIMIPGGLGRQGDGWKLSVRIRLVHAQIRRLLNLSGEWDVAAYGMPLSAAHIALAAAGFSAQLLAAAIRLGARPDYDERDGFMHIWRYTALLLGVPEAIRFHGEADARELYRIGCLCEPPPEIEAIAMANALINSAPLVVNITDPVERRDIVRYGYRVSRALIGDELANQLLFPRQRTTGVLAWLRWSRWIERELGRWFPSRPRTAQKFMTLLQTTEFESRHISYLLPDQISSDPSKEW